jgi:hypothetical protein
MDILRTYEKAKKVIDSCTNQEQLKNAQRYCNNFFTQFSKTVSLNPQKRVIKADQISHSFYNELLRLIKEKSSRLPIYFLCTSFLFTSCTKDPLEDLLEEPFTNIEIEVGNYGTPNHSYINSTTGGVIRNKLSPGYYVTRENSPIALDTVVNGKKYLAVESALQIFDYNNDGKEDIFALMMESTPCSDSCGWITGPGLWLWWPDYKNTNAPIIVDSHIWFGARFELGDLNGDGKLEVIVINQNHHSNGSGGWYAPYHPLEIVSLTDSSISFEDVGPPSSAHDLATGDIDNDGDIDIIEAEWMYGAPFTPSSPKFYINNGSGQFEITKELFGPYPIFQKTKDYDFSVTNIDLFDFNNDGYLDLLVGENNIENQNWGQNALDFFERSGYHPNDVSVLFGNGTGYFGYENSTSIRYGTPTIAANAGVNVTMMGGNFIDYNNDGYFDYVVASDYNGSGAGFKLFKNVNGETLEDVTNTIVSDYAVLYQNAYLGQQAQISPGDMSTFFDIVILDQDNDGDFDIMPYSQVLMDFNSTFKSGVYWENIGGNFILKK